MIQPGHVWAYIFATIARYLQECSLHIYSLIQEYEEPLMLKLRSKKPKNLPYYIYIYVI